MSRARVVFIGLSVTSSWGNGHATNFRALMSALSAAGHDVVFLERDVPWYAEHRDLPQPPWGQTFLYSSVDELRTRYLHEIQAADAVVVGSYVPEGVEVGELVCEAADGATFFYDIDTPITLEKLESGEDDYLTPELAARFDVYLSFTDGDILERLHDRYGIREPVAFYCMVDPATHHPEDVSIRWDLGYLGTYSADRQPSLERLLIEPSRVLDDVRCVVAGPNYPNSTTWPANVERIEHLPPGRHRAFYNAQRFTLNVTRRAMIESGSAPSVRLFEAAACGVPVISDHWVGLDNFFAIGDEILVARSGDDVVRYLREVTEDERRAIGARARRRVLSEHTAEVRAQHLIELMDRVRNKAERP